MSEIITEETKAPETPESLEEPKAHDVTETKEPEAPAGGDAEKPEAGTDLPPEVLQRELRSARDDAAKYRTKYQEAVSQLKGAKSVQEFEAARETFEADLKAATRRADLMQVAVDVKGFPAGLKDMLQGETYDELKAAAEKVVKEIASIGRVVSEEVDGGLAAGDDTGSSYDPHEEARRMREKSRRGY